MSKYTRYLNSEIDTKSPLVDGEKIIWEGKPKKSAFILNNIMVMFPFALIWLLFDGFCIFMILRSAEDARETWAFAIPFFALHLMPVWIWLGNVLTANKKWKNAKYFITDKRIIIQNGIFSETHLSIFYKDISNVSLHVGIIDKILGVGDIYFSIKDEIYNTTNIFFDIKEYDEIYKKAQKIVLDMQTDIEFPNAYRPDNNPGYNTEYKPEE